MNGNRSIIKLVVVTAPFRNSACQADARAASCLSRGPPLASLLSDESAKLSDEREEVDGEEGASNAVGCRTYVLRSPAAAAGMDCVVSIRVSNAVPCGSRKTERSGGDYIWKNGRCSKAFGSGRKEERKEEGRNEKLRPIPMHKAKGREICVLLAVRGCRRGRGRWMTIANEGWVTTGIEQERGHG